MTRKKILLFILIIAIISIASYAGVKIWKAKKNTVVQIEQKTNKIDTSDWKTYRNEEYGYTLKYPKNWIVNDEYKSYVSLISEDLQEDIRNKGNENVAGDNIFYVLKNQVCKNAIEERKFKELKNELINGINWTSGTPQNSGKWVKYYFAFYNNNCYVFTYSANFLFSTPILKTFEFLK